MDQNLRNQLIEKTKKQLPKAISRDILIIQTIQTIDSLDIIINKIITSIRERYGYYAHKTSKIENINILLREVKKQKKEISGINLNQKDLNSILDLVKESELLLNLKQSQENYLESLMKEQCPNLLETATSLIGARLISIAGSLKHLAEIPSSTIQILGAEKALFRHIKTKAKAPKFGVLFAHPEISRSENKGKTARKLASKISIAVKKDYFRSPLEKPLRKEE